MAGAAAIAICLSGLPGSGAPAGAETIRVEKGAPTHPFPHFWEQMFGSGRAILSLRDAYREDLRATRRITGFRYVRFHGILDDQKWACTARTRRAGPLQFLLSLMTSFDGLLANGVRPFVELSFMPAALAASQTPARGFWYRPLPNPPSDYGLLERTWSIPGGASAPWSGRRRMR